MILYCDTPKENDENIIFGTAGFILEIRYLTSFHSIKYKKYLKKTYLHNIFSSLLLL